MLMVADGALKIDCAEIEPRPSLFSACVGDPRHQVADMDHAARIVERLAIDREPRMLGLAEHAHQLGDGHRVLHGDDVGARHHDVLDRELAEARDVEHGALLRAEGVAVAAPGQRVLDHLAQIGLLAEAEAGEQALEPGRLLVGE